MTHKLCTFILKESAGKDSSKASAMGLPSGLGTPCLAIRWCCCVGQSGKKDKKDKKKDKKERAEEGDEGKESKKEKKERREKKEEKREKSRRKVRVGRRTRVSRCRCMIEGFLGDV